MILGAIYDLFDPDGVVDTTYENIARGDGALYSENTTLVEDLIIRAYSIIGSIDERKPDKRIEAVTQLIALTSTDRYSTSGTEGTNESALFSNHIKEAFEAKVAFQKNVLSGVMGQNFDTSSLTKEGIESLNIMQAAVPGAQQLFSAAEDALKSNNVFSGVPDDVEIDNVTMQVFTDESGRTNFDYRDSDGEIIELRTEDGIFTDEFFDDERITGKFARAAAHKNFRILI